MSTTAPLAEDRLPVLTTPVPLPHGITLACRHVGALGLHGVGDGDGGGPSPGRPRVLMLHGFPEAAFVWDPLLQALAPQADGLAPNLRGYIGSSSPAEPEAYRARPLVADLVALIDRWCGPDGTVDLLVAHDWGGALAWALAAQHPARLRQLMILNAPHPATFLRELRHNPAQQAASAYMTRLCEPQAQAWLEADGFAALWPFFGEARWLTPALRNAYLQAWSHPGGGLRGPLAYYRASPLRPATAQADTLAGLQLPDAAVTVPVPTTVLWGLQDHALLPGLLDGLDRWVPRLDVRPVPQASHWIVHEQPEQVLAVVREKLLADAGAAAVTHPGKAP